MDNILKAIFLVCLIFTSLNSTILKQSNNRLQLSSGASNNLKFENSTGPGITLDQIIAFKKAVTDVSSVWGGNITKNLDYITNYMNSYGGDLGDEFFVFIQTDSYANNWEIYSYDWVFATFSGINSYYPSWSYMVVLGGIKKSSRYYTIVQSIGTGSGIDLSTSGFISNLLGGQDKGSYCSCYVQNVQKITQVLNYYDNQDWNAICGSIFDVHAQFEPLNSQWIYTKGPNCYYLLWVS